MARLLGRESVSSDVAALFELVKNGYDADAEKVTVRFENFLGETTKNGRIIVSDIGDGMTIEDIQNKWMIIGTDSKERELFTKKKKRRVIGNKGVGRFATEKLCHCTTIISKPKEILDEIKLQINWDNYEKEGITFDQVVNPVEISQRSDKNDKGTTIILENLRESWTTNKIERLRNSIGAIIIPSKLKQTINDPFTVKVEAPEFPIKEISEIQSTLLKNAPYEIRADILDNETKYRVNIYKQKGLEFSERVDLTDTTMDNGEKWKSFGKCRLRIFMFPDKSIYDDWTEHYHKVLKIKNIKESLQTVRGVKIYRDNFWVRPYGEPEDDWLSLEKERVQANFKVGNSQIVGFIEISKDGNPRLIDTTTRERLVENTAFHCMRTFVKESIDVMSFHRREANKKLREKRIKLEHENIIESEINSLKNVIKENSKLPTFEKTEIVKSLNNITKVFKDFKGEMLETTERLQISERAYRNLAALGISSATTAHEIGRIAGHTELIPKKIFANIQKHPEVLELVQDDFDRLNSKLSAIKHFMAFIINFVESLTYDNRIKHKRESININSELKNMFEDFAGVMKVNNLKLDWKISPDRISIVMNKADFESIVLNLLSNSLRAVRKLNDNVERRVKISITKDEKFFKIKFSDNGTGITDINRDKIFRLFFTTTKNGTGLGLPIIQEILEEYQGTIELKDNSELANGATFVIKIPISELRT